MMRMWMIQTKYLCRKHLLGEHSELHKHKHNFEKGHSIAGRIHPVVTIEPHSMQIRHDEIVSEFKKRGYNHNSPYLQPDVSKYPDVKVDTNISINELSSRCPECTWRIRNYK